MMNGLNLLAIGMRSMEYIEVSILIQITQKKDAK